MITTRKAMRSNGVSEIDRDVLLDGEKIGHILNFGKGRNGGWVGYSIHKRYRRTGHLYECIGPYTLEHVGGGRFRRPKRATKAEAIAFVAEAHAAWLLLADMPDPLA